MTPLSRREFVGAGIAAGAGLVIGFYLPHGKESRKDFSPNAYLRITPDNKVTVVVARSEMGQGVRTALPMILAEELELPRIQPKGSARLKTERDHYSQVSKVGPESLRHFKRTYKEAFKHTVARGIIIEGSGSHFDPVVVDAFLQIQNECIAVHNEFSAETESSNEAALSSSC